MTKRPASSGAGDDPGLQESSARKGAQAKDGVEPQPGDPTSPEEAAQRAAGRAAEMRESGFGDQEGGRI